MCNQPPCKFLLLLLTRILDKIQYGLLLQQKVLPHLLRQTVAGLRASRRGARHMPTNQRYVHMVGIK